jgi:hypothetical protein
MKKLFAIVFIGFCGISVQTYAQTNRINHYSHSGSSKTLDVFKANDNMGLNCGSVSSQEFIPDTTVFIHKRDSAQIDTSKYKVCKPIIPAPEKPRRGLSLTPTFKVQDVLNKF